MDRLFDKAKVWHAYYKKNSRAVIQFYGCRKMKFKNEAYEDLVKDLISDTFYIESRPNRGKISTARQYAEVVVRKIIDIPQGAKVTLGDHAVIKKLEKVSSNDDFLMGAVEKLRELGNKCTHTQDLKIISDADVDSSVEALFKLYASLFILYFKKYRFGSNNEVMSAFSILPPIIRFFVLDNLYESDRYNLSIIDKLSLVLLKAFDMNDALSWLNERKDELSNILPYTPEAIADIEAAYGKQHAEIAIANAPANMYVSCLERLETVKLILETQGLLYSSFEQAKELYLTKGILDDKNAENREFNDLMEFVYLGRKVEVNEKLSEQHLYSIIVQS